MLSTPRYSVVLPELVSRKIQQLESQKILETRDDEKMRLEKVIADHLSEQKQIEHQLHELGVHISG